MIWKFTTSLVLGIGILESLYIKVEIMINSEAWKWRGFRWV